MTELTLTSALKLEASIRVAGLNVPRSLERGIQLAERFNELRFAPRERGVLALKDSQIQAFYERRVLHETSFVRVPLTPAWDGAHEHVENDLFAEVRSELLGEVDELIDQMREPFEAVGAELTKHVNDHSLSSMSSEKDVLAVLDAGGTDEAMIAKAHALHDSRALLPKLGPFAALRRALSETLDLSPTPAERSRVAGIDEVAENDWSILFAAGDNWSVNGHNNRNRDPKSSLDWLTLAAGGIAMNSVDTVQAKLRARMSFFAATTPITALDDDE